MSKGKTMKVSPDGSNLCTTCTGCRFLTVQEGADLLSVVGCTDYKRRKPVLEDQMSMTLEGS